MTSVPTLADPRHEDRLARVRRFSRFDTQRPGLLHRELLASGFTLTQSRMLWELAQLLAQAPPAEYGQGVTWELQLHE
jgi:hypothetical protein